MQRSSPSGAEQLNPTIMAHDSNQFDRRFEKLWNDPPAANHHRRASLDHAMIILHPHQKAPPPRPGPPRPRDEIRRNSLTMESSSCWSRHESKSDIDQPKKPLRTHKIHENKKLTSSSIVLVVEDETTTPRPPPAAPAVFDPRMAARLYELKRNKCTTGSSTRENNAGTTNNKSKHTMNEQDESTHHWWTKKKNPQHPTRCRNVHRDSDHHVIKKSSTCETVHGIAGEQSNMECAKRTSRGSETSMQRTYLPSALVVLSQDHQQQPQQQQQRSPLVKQLSQDSFFSASRSSLRSAQDDCSHSTCKGFKRSSSIRISLSVAPTATVSTKLDPSEFGAFIQPPLKQGDPSKSKSRVKKAKRRRQSAPFSLSNVGTEIGTDSKLLENKHAASKEDYTYDDLGPPAASTCHHHHHGLKKSKKNGRIKRRLSLIESTPPASNKNTENMFDMMHCSSYQQRNDMVSDPPVDEEDRKDDAILSQQECDTSVRLNMESNDVIHRRHSVSAPAIDYPDQENEACSSNHRLSIRELVHGKQKRRSGGVDAMRGNQPAASGRSAPEIDGTAIKKKQTKQSSQHRRRSLELGTPIHCEVEQKNISNHKVPAVESAPGSAAKKIDPQDYNQESSRLKHRRRSMGTHHQIHGESVLAMGVEPRVSAIMKPPENEVGSKTNKNTESESEHQWCTESSTIVPCAQLDKKKQSSSKNRRSSVPDVIRHGEGKRGKGGNPRASTEADKPTADRVKKSRNASSRRVTGEPSRNLEGEADHGEKMKTNPDVEANKKTSFPHITEFPYFSDALEFEVGMESSHHYQSTCLLVDQSLQKQRATETQRMEVSARTQHPADNAVVLKTTANVMTENDYNSNRSVQHNVPRKHQDVEANWQTPRQGKSKETRPIPFSRSQSDRARSNKWSTFSQHHESSFSMLKELEQHKLFSLRANGAPYRNPGTIVDDLFHSRKYSTFCTQILDEAWSQSMLETEDRHSAGPSHDDSSAQLTIDELRLQVQALYTETPSVPSAEDDTIRDASIQMMPELQTEANSSSNKRQARDAASEITEISDLCRDESPDDITVAAGSRNRGEWAVRKDCDYLTVADSHQSLPSFSLSKLLATTSPETVSTGSGASLIEEPCPRINSIKQPTLDSMQVIDEKLQNLIENTYHMKMFIEVERMMLSESHATENYQKNKAALDSLDYLEDVATNTLPLPCIVERGASVQNSAARSESITKTMLPIYEESGTELIPVCRNKARLDDKASKIDPPSESVSSRADLQNSENSKPAVVSCLNGSGLEFSQNGCISFIIEKADPTFISHDGLGNLDTAHLSTVNMIESQENRVSSNVHTTDHPRKEAGASPAPHEETTASSCSLNNDVMADMACDMVSKDGDKSSQGTAKTVGSTSTVSTGNSEDSGSPRNYIDLTQNKHGKEHTIETMSEAFSKVTVEGNVVIAANCRPIEQPRKVCMLTATTLRETAPKEDDSAASSCLLNGITEGTAPHDAHVLKEKERVDENSHGVVSSCMLGSVCDEERSGVSATLIDSSPNDQVEEVNVETAAADESERFAGSFPVHQSLRILDDATSSNHAHSSGLSNMTKRILETNYGTTLREVPGSPCGRIIPDIGSKQHDLEILMQAIEFDTLCDLDHRWQQAKGEEKEQQSKHRDQDCELNKPCGGGIHNKSTDMAESGSPKTKHRHFNLFGRYMLPGRRTRQESICRPQTGRLAEGPYSGRSIRSKGSLVCPVIAKTLLACDQMNAMLLDKLDAEIVVPCFSTKKEDAVGDVFNALKCEATRKLEVVDRNSSSEQSGGVAQHSLDGGPFIAIEPVDLSDASHLTCGASVGESISTMYVDCRRWAIEIGGMKRAGNYTGPMSHGGIPQGEGILCFDDGDVYEGPFLDGEMHGPCGKYIWHHDGDQYMGDFWHNLRHGNGEQWIGERGMFIGQFYYDLEHGYGVQYDDDGVITFKGQWEHGLPLREATLL